MSFLYTASFNTYSRSSTHFTKLDKMEKKFVKSEPRRKRTKDLSALYSTVYKFRAPNCKFSRAERFPMRRLSFGGEYTTLPATVGIGRRASFGFGKRIEFRNPGGASSPPCNTYNIPSCFDKITGGMSSPDNSPLKSYQKSLSLKRETSPVSGSGMSMYKNRFSIEAANSSFIEMHSTPGPRRVSLS